MLIETILLISPYGELIFFIGAVYLIACLGFYHAKYKKKKYKLNQYWKILVNMFVGALAFFSGPALLLMGESKKIEFPGYIFTFCALIPSLSIVLFAIGNLILTKKMKEKKLRYWFLP
jgi:hypothetical protein